MLIAEIIGFCREREEFIMAIVAPSILSADYMNMQRDLDMVKAAGVKWLHVDIMDGIFVPNITFGYGFVKSMRKVSDLVLDVHLMIDRPIRYVQQFCDAGADYLTIHVESDTPENTLAALEKIRALGVKPGIVVKPNTPAEAIEAYLPLVDLVLVMTVEPGFGGQKFMQDMMPKVTEIRQEIDRRGLAVSIEVDGGVNMETAPICAAAGADVAVAGSAFFNMEDPTPLVDALHAL